MHAYNMLHRDIKSDNIFLRPNGGIKIADLGVSVFLSEERKNRSTVIGTKNWLSPEIVKGAVHSEKVPYSKEADVWAFGCLAYELATGEPPFFAPENDTYLVFSAI
jgi:serine/threonine protein kinase